MATSICRRSVTICSGFVLDFAMTSLLPQGWSLSFPLVQKRPVTSPRTNGRQPTMIGVMQEGVRDTIQPLEWDVTQKPGVIGVGSRESFFTTRTSSGSSWSSHLRAETRPTQSGPLVRERVDAQFEREKILAVPTWISYAQTRSGALFLPLGVRKRIEHSERRSKNMARLVVNA